MKTKQLTTMMAAVLLMLGFACCSSDDGEAVITNGEVEVTGEEAESTSADSIHKAILGEWKFTKSATGSESLSGVDRLVFYSDSTFAYHLTSSGDEMLKGWKYEIVNYDCNVGTVDMQQIPSKYLLRLFYSEESGFDGRPLAYDYCFIIEGNKMHLYMEYTYVYTSYLFERVK